MNARQEELEKLIKKVFTKQFAGGDLGDISIEPDKKDVECLIQAILSAGYVKKDEIGLDEFRIAKILAKKEYCGEKCASAAYEIAQSSKEIIKVKEIIK